SDRNRRLRGFSFKRARWFEWHEAMEFIDTRFAYAEIRSVAFGFIADRLYVLAFSRRGGKIRVISLRKANQREART
ncbi:BrnT family toxin, partial [Staphylococcus aureus]